MTQRKAPLKVLIDLAQLIHVSLVEWEQLTRKQIPTIYFCFCVATPFPRPGAGVHSFLRAATAMAVVSLTIFDESQDQVFQFLHILLTLFLRKNSIQELLEVGGLRLLLGSPCNVLDHEVE